MESLWSLRRKLKKVCTVFLNGVPTMFVRACAFFSQIKAYIYSHWFLTPLLAAQICSLILHSCSLLTLFFLLVTATQQPFVTMALDANCSCCCNTFSSVGARGWPEGQSAALTAAREEKQEAGVFQSFTGIYVEAVQFLKRIKTLLLVPRSSAVLLNVVLNVAPYV